MKTIIDQLYLAQGVLLAVNLQAVVPLETAVLMRQKVKYESDTFLIPKGTVIEENFITSFLGRSVRGVKMKGHYQASPHPNLKFHAKTQEIDFSAEHWHFLKLNDFIYSWLLI